MPPDEKTEAKRVWNGRQVPKSGRAKRSATTADPAAPEAKAINSVRPARQRRRSPEDAAGETDESKSRASEKSTTEDPLAVQDLIGDRYLRQGDLFYFRDGRQAFEDHGRKLSTLSENVKVIVTLLELARGRGWTDIQVEGSARFRRHAWRQGHLAGLAVRGYAPSAAEHAGMIRALSEHGKNGSHLAPETQELSQSSLTCESPYESSGAARFARRDAILKGTLLAHGMAPYRSKPHREMSYFIRIGTYDGPRTIWSKDLRRALERSRTQPKVGDEVVLRRLPVTGWPSVTENLAGETGPMTADRPTRRQGWVIEKREFFELRARAADTLRNAGVPQTAGIRLHPELAGAYLLLRAAELTARRLEPAGELRTFLEAVRRRMADSIARGDAFPQARLRQRSEGAADLERGQPLTR